MLELRVVKETFKILFINTNSGTKMNESISLVFQSKILNNIVCYLKQDEVLNLWLTFKSVYKIISQYIIDNYYFKSRKLKVTKDKYKKMRHVFIVDSMKFFSFKNVTHLDISQIPGLGNRKGSFLSGCHMLTSLRI